MEMQEKAKKNDQELEFLRQKYAASSSAGVPNVSNGVPPMIPPAMEPPAGMPPMMMQPRILPNDQLMMNQQFETLSQPHKELVLHIVKALSKS